MKKLLTHVVMAFLTVLVFTTSAPTWLSDLFAVLCWILVSVGLLVTVGCMEDTITSLASRPRHGPIHRTVIDATIVTEAVAIASSGRTYLAACWLVLLGLLIFARREADNVRAKKTRDEAQSASA